MIEMIGIGCRFPGDVSGPKAFVELLRSSQSAIDSVPSSRWNASDYVSAEGRSKPGRSVTDRAGWLRQIDQFDTSFFHLSPREAREMDPQQRLMLEVSLEAIFDAQINPSWLQERKTGVFVGAGFAEFQGMSFGRPSEITSHTMLGTSLSIIANRLSYFLDLRGPSMTIDTACSSALTAFHLACQSLRTGECDVAVVGGINTMLSPSPFIGYTQASMLSPTGICSPFDAKANGFVRGEGCGVVVLRRAEFDTDIPHRRIYAYVRANGVGEDGRTASMTKPSGVRQQQLMEDVLASASIDVEDVVYVEAHGTGTPVGDPIEALSIARAHRGNRTAPLAMGSVKGHLGHLETAAGIAGVIKGALCLHHNILVPTAGFSEWSPDIDAETHSLRIPTCVEKLPRTQTGGSPLVGVCSYGFGGANAYVLLQQAHLEGEAVNPVKPGESGVGTVHHTRAFALPISAHYPEGLEALESSWQNMSSQRLREAALWSAQTRPSLYHRKIWIGLDQDDFFSNATVVEGEHAGVRPPIVFCFGGQGSQYPHMGRRLYQEHPVFRHHIHSADRLFAAHSGYSLIDTYGFCQREMDAETLQDVTVALPCIVLSQIALCALLREVGVVPDAVIGHSTGEMVAGWIAGAYDLDTLCRLTHIRASMQSKMQPGAMMTWNQNETDTRAVLQQLELTDNIVIAAVNTEQSLTLSGDVDAVETLLAWGKEQGVRGLRLAVPRAYHSHHVDAIADELRERLQTIKATVPNIPFFFFSTVQGRTGVPAKVPLDADYWFDNIRKPVNFAKGCQAISVLGGVYLEVSPHRVLSSYIAKNLNTPVVACLDQRQEDDLSFLHALGQLYAKGVPVRWEGWAKPSQFVSIPVLPWKHTAAFRSDVWQMPGQQITSQPKALLVKAPRSSQEQIVLTPQSHPYLRDHVIGKQVVMPGAGYIAEWLHVTGRSSLTTMRFHRMLSLWKKNNEAVLGIQQDDDSVLLHQGGQTYFSASTKLVEASQKERLEPLGLQAVQERCQEIFDLKRLYQAHAKHSGLGFGKSFQGIQSIHAGDAEGIATIEAPSTAFSHLHTTVLDACFQSLVMLRGVDSDPFLPHSVDSLWIEHSFPSEAILCHTVLREITKDALQADCDMYDQSGRYLGGIRGVHLQRARMSVQLPVQMFTTHYQTCKSTDQTNYSKVCVLGELDSYWFGTVQELGDASLIVDARNSLTEASQLLRDIIETGQKPTVLFVYPEGMSGSMPSPLLGLARAARNENPDVPVYACGIPSTYGPEQKVAFLQYLLGHLPHDEFELVLRDDTWEVPRLQTFSLDTMAWPHVDDHRLIVERPGQLASLRWHPLRKGWEGLREGELQLRVNSVSLHFKDIMLAMGMLDDFKPILGMECCGTILAMGPGVAEQFPELSPGMDVLCLSMTTDVGEHRSSLLGTVATIQARQAIPKPEGLSDQEAAGFLGVTATAWYSLSTIGKLQKGETILIHSGAGGVGQAAIQIAQTLGATVISSAGNEDKRNFLRQKFTLDLVLDSHSPESFYESVRRYTRGQGVDVVLNSLAEDGLTESLRCLGPGGRHLEIGKRDIFADRKLGLQILKENVSFHSIQLDLLDHSHPQRVRQLLLDCVQMLQAGKLKPVDTTVYAAGDVVDAFRYMSSGQHTGKIVIAIPNPFVPTEPSHVTSQAKSPLVPTPLMHAEEAQLITGGTRGLGLAFAQFLAQQGACHLILLGRSENVSQRTQVVLDSLQREHPHCDVRRVGIDVRDKAALQELFATSAVPITGVFHAANLYATGTADRITEADSLTYDIKVQGALHLHEISQAYPLRHFVLFSSLAGLHGNTRQASYVAANAALQQLAVQRRQAGLPGLAIDFPIMLGAGRLSEGAFVRELELNTNRGFGALSFTALESHLTTLLAYLEQAPAHVSLDYPQWDSYQRMQRYHAFYEHLIPKGQKATTLESQAEVVVTPKAKPTRSIATSVVSRVAFLLGCHAEDVGQSIPLPELGIDSLAAIELSEWVQNEYHIDISQADVLAGLTVDGVVDGISNHPDLVSTGATDHTEVESREPEAWAGEGQRIASRVSEPPHVGADMSLVKSTGTPKLTPSLGLSFRAELLNTEELREPSDSVTVDKLAEIFPAFHVPPSTQFMPEQSVTDVLVVKESLEDTEQWTVLPLKHEQPPSDELTVTTIEVSSTLTLASLERIFETVLQSSGVLVFRSHPEQEYFCTGLDLKAMPFGSHPMNEGLVLFAQLYEVLDAYPMPVVSVVEGACRGGGMLFPLMSSVVLATDEASFGFPEVRRGGLPGVVSVAAQRRMSQGHSERYMLTGDSFSAERAMQIGVVDFVGWSEDVAKELQRVLGRFQTIPIGTLNAFAEHCPAPDLPQALVAMGGFGQSPVEKKDHTKSLVDIRLEEETGVAILSLNDPLRSNAMGVSMATDLKRAIHQLRTHEKVRAVVFRGIGEHFCVGVNPYQFVREVQQLPLFQASRVIYDIYRAFVGLRDLDVPVICLVHGKVVGGGLATMLNADYRIAVAHSLFHYGNLPRGVCPGLLLSENLGRTVGDAVAMRLYLRDEPLYARDAKTLGLIHDVLPTLEEATQTAVALARRLAQSSRTGIQHTLSLMRPPIDEARLAKESLGMARCLLEGDAFTGQWSETPESIPLVSVDPSIVKNLQANEPNILHARTLEFVRPQRVKHVGILAMELYTPNHMVRQEELEEHLAQPGKFTSGLGQEEIGFCSDEEDAISMALTVVHSLIEKHGLSWKDIGRLEVGTESPTDRSKSIKTHLMSLFVKQGCYDVEGVDTYNACYGGTAALFNTVAWCQSDTWDGRYGLVVCVDIADLNREQIFLNGAAAVAMLVGPDAALSMGVERGSHMMHTWDFYKPVGWSDSYPLMRDGKHSIDVYMQSLDGCQKALVEKLNGQCLLTQHDYFVFHCTSTYLCKRAFDRVVANSSLKNLSLQERQRLYQSKVFPGTQLTRRIGSSYTASCYVNLYSLLLHAKEELIDKTICMYSYGSGSSASMFRLNVRSLPKMDTSVLQHLNQRHQHTPDEFVSFVDQYSAAYGRFDFSPEQRNDRSHDVYYLERVDEWGRRYYKRYKG